MAEKLHEQSFGWHADLPDVPGKSAAEMKAFFDAPSHAFLDKINELIDEIGQIGQKTEEIQEKANYFESTKNKVEDIEKALPGEDHNVVYPTIGAVVKLMDSVKRTLDASIQNNATQIQVITAETGNVDAALSEILVLQQSFIGGDAV